MNSSLRFEVGDVFENHEIVARFKCGNMGGMRRSLATNSLVIISDHTKGLYDDKWYGDILHYTGMGKRGDQALFFMQNKTLAEAAFNGVDIHLFEVFKAKRYVYQGIMEMAGEPYIDEQIGEDGRKRNVWMFPLKPKDTESSISEDVMKERLLEQEKEARTLTDRKLYERAANRENTKVSRRIVKSNLYFRDPFIAEYAKRRAKGKCQLCEKPAPFNNHEGLPYLECHHIDWISKGGSDTIDNTVALCPNCHRRMHVINMEGDIDKLRRIARKEDEFSSFLK